MSPSVECLTPPGTGGVAVIAVQGPGALELVGTLTEHLPGVGKLRLCRLTHAGETLDEALIVRRGAQHLELGLHGGPALVAEVLDALGGDLPAPASVEAGALAALDSAPCDRAARVLLDQAEGALRRAVESQREQVEPSAWLPVWERHARLLVPATVVLAGPVNAGKSTLFNLLVGEERVTVSAQEGTTRDAIVGRVRVGHHALDLIDTAGERGLEGGQHPDSAEGVEAAGQALGRALRGRADLVLWLAPAGAGTAEPPPDLPGEALVLRTRADELAPAARPPGAISAAAHPIEALAAVTSALARGLCLPAEDPWCPGRPVPPTRAVAEELDLALGSPPGPDRDTALDRALGPADALMLP